MANSLQIERVLDSFFEFTLNDKEPVSDSAPSVTFIGNYCHFKTKNGANIVKEQDVLVSEVTVVDTFGGSGNFVYNNPASLFLKLLELNFFQDRVSAITGVTRFDALLDTFKYFGNNGKVPVVDEAQLKLVPTNFYNYNNLIQLDDVAIDNLVQGKYLKVESVDGQLKVVLSDINTSSTNTTLKKIEYTAEEGDTEIQIDNAPSQIFLFKNGVWQIEDENFTYSAGVVTLLQEAYEDDYFEAIPLSSSVKKFVITATSDNQTEFNYDGNPAFTDVYLKGNRLREGVDFSRTTFSTNNKIIIINQYLIDDILTGDILEIITY